MATIPSGTKFLGVDPAFTDLTEKKGIKVDRKSEYFTLEDITAAVGTGSQGAEGPEGPAGPPGPVGPAGLEWQGAWDTDSSYAEDDAVGFNGASWFCISAVTGTGNSNPEEDTTHWALLAAQGAQGIQGIQGPIGPQGASGAAVYKSYVSTILFNSSGDPLVTSVYSDIQDGVSISISGTGVYQISSSNRFTSNKTIISPFADQGSTTNSGAIRLPIYSSNVVVGYYWLQRINSGEIRLNFVDTSSNPINPNTLLGSRKIVVDFKVYN
jgi:hypothetical protein